MPRENGGIGGAAYAGTSYLEALRTIAALDGVFFRKIYAYARECYPADKASYHVSATLSRAPAPEDLSDADLPRLLDQFDAREMLHVTFGSVLTALNPDGSRRFRDRMIGLLRANQETYAQSLEKHFARHLQPFAQGL